MIKKQITLSSAAQLCGGEILGDAGCQIAGVCSVENPIEGHLAYVGSSFVAKRTEFIDNVLYIVKPEWASHVKNGLVHEQPQKAFRQLLVALSETPHISNIARSATISDSVKLGDNVSIGDNSVIHSDVIIGDGCHIGCGVIIESGSEIGDNTRIEHNVVIHHGNHIGDRCVISTGAVIGGQGFGFSFEGGSWEAMPQVGRVILGNDVHIGANSCIDRGAIDDTIIDNNVIIDNVVHIAHNVKIGSGTAIAAGVGIAGSAVIGKHCMFGGLVGIAGHITIADGVQINGGSKILKSIEKAGAYSGALNVLPSTQWNRMMLYLFKIDKLFRREKKHE